jgi:hypothetical protein
MTVAEIFFWASKKLVTGPNGIMPMVAQTFCDIFFMKKRHHADFCIFIFFLNALLGLVHFVAEIE